MKILLVSPYFSSHGGGIEKVAARLAAEVASHGLSVTLCALDCGEQVESGTTFEVVKLTGSNIVERRLNFPYPLIGWVSLIKLWELVRRADVVHVHDYIYFSSLFAFIAAKITGKRVLITQHIGMINYRSKILRWLLSSLNKTLGALILSKASCVIFISDQVKGYFEDIVSSPRDWFYIPNGVDIDIFKPSLSLANVNGRKKRILFVGRFVEKKGIEFLKCVVEKLGMFDWAFVGRGPLSPESWNASCVKFVGAVESRQELAEIYRNSDLLVLPSHGEGFPLVVQEALATGLPVLTSADVAEGCKAVKEYLLIEDIWGSDTWVKWVARITAVMSGYEPGGGAASKAAVDFAKENWDWRIIAKKYITLYEMPRAES